MDFELKHDFIKEAVRAEEGVIELHFHESLRRRKVKPENEPRLLALFGVTALDQLHGLPVMLIVASNTVLMGIMPCI